MSLFRLLGMGVDDDDYYSDPSRQMNAMLSNHFNMMGSLLESPFALMGPTMSPFMDRSRRNMFNMDMMPVDDAFMNPFRMIENLQPSAHPVAPPQMFYSSNIVHMTTNGPDGRPEVYQASSSMRQGPGGVRESVKAVSDSRSGVKKMAIGHHIGERGHVIERERNYRAGTEEERQQFINIEEEEADEFENNFRHLSNQPRHAPVPHQQYLSLTSGLPRQRMSSAHDGRKKRPLEIENGTSKRKNPRTVATSEPIPVVEVPDSDSEENPSPSSNPKTKKGPTIVEVID